MCRCVAPKKQREEGLEDRVILTGDAEVNDAPDNYFIYSFTIESSKWYNPVGAGIPEYSKH